MSRAAAAPQLASGLDPERLAPLFARFGRLHLPGVLRDDHARAVGRALAQALWSQSLNVGDKPYEIDPGGHIEEGYAPAFNALNIFRVPKRHAVTQVASFAGAERLSVTGWIRERR